VSICKVFVKVRLAGIAENLHRTRTNLGITLLWHFFVMQYSFSQLARRKLCLIWNSLVGK